MELLAAFDPAGLIGAVAGLIALAIGAYVTIAVEKIKVKAAETEAAAKRAEKAAAQAKAEVTWILHGGPEW